MGLESFSTQELLNEIKNRRDLSGNNFVNSFYESVKDLEKTNTKLYFVDCNDCKYVFDTINYDSNTGIVAIDIEEV